MTERGKVGLTNFPTLIYRTLERVWIKIGERTDGRVYSYNYKKREIRWKEQDI